MFLFILFLSVYSLVTVLFIYSIFFVRLKKDLFSNQYFQFFYSLARFSAETEKKIISDYLLNNDTH